MNLLAVFVVGLVEAVAAVLLLGGWVRRSPGRLLAAPAVALVGMGMLLPRYATPLVGVAMLCAVAGAVGHLLLRRRERASRRSPNA
ncbi:hypothetical protein ABZ569_32715 [Streptomyces albus]|uniref:hypothetical protein n=1 Tax=Streptomyces albus TaxID=1888 RepID=UPI00340AC2E1